MSTPPLPTLEPAPKSGPPLVPPLAPLPFLLRAPSVFL